MAPSSEIHPFIHIYYVSTSVGNWSHISNQYEHDPHPWEADDQRSETGSWHRSVFKIQYAVLITDPIWERLAGGFPRRHSVRNNLLKGEFLPEKQKHWLGWQSYPSREGMIKPPGLSAEVQHSSGKKDDRVGGKQQGEHSHLSFQVHVSVFRDLVDWQRDCNCTLGKWDTSEGYSSTEAQSCQLIHTGKRQTEVS